MTGAPERAWLPEHRANPNLNPNPNPNPNLNPNPNPNQVRQSVPGFLNIERHLATWLHARYGTVVELFYAHGLRQGPETLRSTGFDVHQDTEDYDFIEYTIVVKLTPDRPGEPPSAMR